MRLDYPILLKSPLTLPAGSPLISNGYNSCNEPNGHGIPTFNCLCTSSIIERSKSRVQMQCMRLQQWVSQNLTSCRISALRQQNINLKMNALIFKLMFCFLMTKILNRSTRGTFTINYVLSVFSSVWFCF